MHLQEKKIEKIKFFPPVKDPLHSLWLKNGDIGAKSEKPQDEVDREHQELWDGFGNKKERTEPYFGY